MGPLSLQTVARLLPETPRELTLLPELDSRYTSVVHLSWFERLPHLQLLEVSSSSRHLPMLEEDASCFQLGCPFPYMNMLHLSPWPLQRVGPAAGINRLIRCLPSLQQLDVRVYIDSGDAQEISRKLKLEILKLTLLNDDDDDEEEEDDDEDEFSDYDSDEFGLEVKVFRDSSLRKLKLIGPKKYKEGISLIVYKPEVLVDCKYIRRVHMLASEDVVYRPFHSEQFQE